MPNPYQLVWMFLMYDLPMKEPQDAKMANQFRHQIENMGFIRLQYSIYKRFCGTYERFNSYERKIGKILPRKGEIRLLAITDKQYGSMRIYECEFSRALANLPEFWEKNRSLNNFGSFRHPFFNYLVKTNN